MTAPSWAAAHYPVTTTCPFCGDTLTIALDGPTTTGHATWCIQIPKSHRTTRTEAA